jgi:hypothetical protein
MNLRFTTLDEYGASQEGRLFQSPERAVQRNRLVRKLGFLGLKVSVEELGLVA